MSFKKFVRVALSLAIACLFAVLCTSSGWSSHVAQAQADYVYEVNPSGYICGTTPPTANIIQAQFAPNVANHNIQVQVQKCSGGAFGSSGDAYVVVDSIPNHSYTVSPTGYACGVTGQSPNIVEMKLAPNSSNHNIRVRIRKCAGGEFSQGGNVFLDVNGSEKWGPISYSAHVSEITFNIDPFPEKGITGVNSYRARVYSNDQPTIAKDTGTITAKEVYASYPWGPFPYAANITTISFDIDPVNQGLLGTHTYRVDVYPSGQNYPIMAGVVQAWNKDAPPPPAVPHTIAWAGGYTAPFLVKPFNDNPDVTARIDHGNPQHVDDTVKIPDYALYATIQRQNGDRLYDSYTTSGEKCENKIGAVWNYYDPFGTCRSYDAHSGHDYGVDAGSDVLAAADGTYVQQNANEGRILHDLNGDGVVDYVSIYRHLRSHVADNNTWVLRGQHVAKSGTAGTGAHLHFSLVRVVDGRWYSTDPYGWWQDGVADPLINWTGNAGETLTAGGVESQWLWLDECPYSNNTGRIFCDVPESSPLFPYIQKMVLRGVTNGCARYDPDGAGQMPEIRFFCPDHLLRRDHAVAFLGRAISGIDEPTEPWSNPYPDLQASSSFYNWIMYFTQQEVIQGYSDGKFHPEEYVTRGQWAKMIVGALNARKFACKYEAEQEFSNDLVDMEPGSTFYNHVWCLWGWLRAYKPDITIGYSDHRFRPDQAITRAESSKWSTLGEELIILMPPEASEGQNNNFWDTVLHFSFWSQQNTDAAAGAQPVDNNRTDDNSVALVVPWDDQDWVKLDVQAVQPLQFVTTHNGLNADIQLEIYDASGTTQLAVKSGFASNGGTILNWSPPASGIYYLKVTNTFKYAREGTNLELVASTIWTPTQSLRLYLPAIKRP